MATNLTTIEVRLQANAKNFQNQINKGSQSVEKLRKSTQKVIPTQKTFQERLRNVSGSIAAVQGPLGPVAGRLNAIGAITGRVSGTLLVGLAAFTALGVGITKFISAGAKAESQALKLEAILKATGFAAGQTAEDIEELAISIGRNTTENEIDQAAIVLQTRINKLRMIAGV